MHITQSLCNQTTGTLTPVPPGWCSDTIHGPGLRLHHHVYHSLQGCGEEKGRDGYHKQHLPMPLSSQGRGNTSGTVNFGLLCR